MISREVVEAVDVAALRCSTCDCRHFYRSRLDGCTDRRRRWSVFVEAEWLISPTLFIHACRRSQMAEPKEHEWSSCVVEAFICRSLYGCIL